jgi:transposase
LGRRTKLTPERRDRILQATRAGCDIEIACRAAGVGTSTYYRWKARGEQEPVGPYRDFFMALRTAEAEAEVHAVAVIRHAMGDDWRAALAFLERRHPGRWGKRTTTELTGPNGGPVKTENSHRVDLTALSNEQLEQLEVIHEQLAAAAQPDQRRR